MGSKVYKGQEVVVEGSLSGETIIVTKFAYDPAFNLEYLGEAKIGTREWENKFFIQKFIYDPAFNLVEILNATNEMTTGAAELTIDTSDNHYIVITLPAGGDFSEVSPQDSISVSTANNKFHLLPVHDTNQEDQVRIRKTDIPANILATIVDEANTSLAPTDVKVRLENERTKPYEKRRWDHRERYIYA